MYPQLSLAISLRILFDGEKLGNFWLKGVGEWMNKMLRKSEDKDFVLSV